MNRPHDIGAVGFHRVGIRLADQGLRGEVEDHFRAMGMHGPAQCVRIADIAEGGHHAIGHLDKIKEVGIGGWRQGDRPRSGR